MLLLVLSLCLTGVFGAEYTLPGECPDVKLQENFDPTKFSGLWYNVASYASDGRDINDCSTIEFKEDNMGYMYKETYVQVVQGNRTQKRYQARVDPTVDAGKNAVFIMSHETGEHGPQSGFFILSTDYDNYAIAYTCSWLKEKIRVHYAERRSLMDITTLTGSMLFAYNGFLQPSLGYRRSTLWGPSNATSSVFTWVLTRNKEKLQGELLKKVEDKLSKYTDLAEHRQSFVFKDFSDASCAYTHKLEIDLKTSNFW